VKKTASPFKKIHLKNGIPVILYPLDHLPSVLLSCDLKSGTVFEDENNFGISHFLEHWIHQGNKLFPSQKLFKQNLEEKGIIQNGSTGTFDCCYYLKAQTKELEQAVRSLYSLLCQPIFPSDRRLHIKQVITSEYNDLWQSPENRFQKSITKRRFLDKPSYLENPLGKIENIVRFKKKEIVEWYEKYYHSGNYLLSIIGCFDEKKLINLLNKNFGKLTKREKINYPKIEKSEYSPFLIHHQPEPREQIYFNLNYPCWGHLEKDIPDQLLEIIITSVLGGGPLSHLNQILREKNNLCYRVSSGMNRYPQNGMLAIQGMVNNKNLLKALDLALKEIRKMKKGGVSTKELKTAKSLISSNTIFKSEDSGKLISKLTSDQLWEQKLYSINQLIKIAERINLEKVNERAKDLFDHSKLNINLFGNLSKKELDKIKQLFPR